MQKSMFIVSSGQFRNVIHYLNPEEYDEYDDIFLVSEGNKVFFESLPERKLDVEIKNPPFRLRLSPEQLKKFYRVLGIIGDQPITITIDSNNNWLNFHAGV
jgi:hypothetical protein